MDNVVGAVSEFPTVGPVSGFETFGDMFQSAFDMDEIDSFFEGLDANTEAAPQPPILDAEHNEHIEAITQISGETRERITLEQLLLSEEASDVQSNGDPSSSRQSEIQSTTQLVEGREFFFMLAMLYGERLAYVVQVRDEYRFNHILDPFVMVLENSNCENWIQIAENNPDLLTVLDFGTSPTRPRAYDNDTRDMCSFQRNTLEHINENQQGQTTSYAEEEPGHPSTPADPTTVGAMPLANGSIGIQDLVRQNHGLDDQTELVNQASGHIGSRNQNHVHADHNNNEATGTSHPKRKRKLKAAEVVDQKCPRMSVYNYFQLLGQLESRIL